MTSFVLKIIALTAMILDHTAAVFPETFGLEFRLIGRLAFPIYVFLIAEGFLHTKNMSKFLLRLLIFAIVSEPFFDLSLGNGLSPMMFFYHTNIFYTLFLGGCAVYVYKIITERMIKDDDSISLRLIASALGLMPVLIFMSMANLLSTDYGGYGVLFILMMYMIRIKAVRLTAMAVLCTWQFVWLIDYWSMVGFSNAPWQINMLVPVTLLTVVFAALYNGKRGPSFKWAFYIIYPAHLFVLYLIRFFIYSYGG